MDENVEVFEKWDEYNLKEELLAGVYDLGFEKPSFIQKTAIAPILNGRDIRAQAQSGTGKTAAFGVALLQSINPCLLETQVLVLVSTREMAEQNASRIESLAKYMDIRVTTLVGGTSYNKCLKDLELRPQVIVGTPGRVFHMISDKAFNINFIKLCVIDEADEMLSQGFELQMLGIFAYLSPKMQIAMFSATWQEREIRVADQLLNNPIIIDLRQDEQTLKGINQFFIALGNRPRMNPDDTKIDALIDIFRTRKIGQCIVFVGTKFRADNVCNRLNVAEIASDVIHASLDTNQRKEVLEKFRDGRTRLLISTEVLSRGIDIQQLSVVINFDLPKSKNDAGLTVLDKSNYIHRIGRAGRFGRKGIALSLIFDEEKRDIEDIQEHYRTSIQELPGDMEFQ